ncbi:MAG: type III-A CRISPR-associated protein Csm2 [Thermodesulforhabdaceae bacterium]|jgi:CRISPR-associated protein Csm2
MNSPHNEDFSGFINEVKDLSKLKIERLVEIAEEVGRRIKENVSVNQIRRFLDGARKIESSIRRGEDKEWEKIKAEIVLLRPKLAYAAGRHNQVKPLAKLLDAAVKSAANSKENFFIFLRFVESIFAYHKFYGGKD